MSDIPMDHRDECSRCGKIVHLKKTGHCGYTDAFRPGASIYRWASRKGTKPTPNLCPVSDGEPRTYHTVEGYATIYYGDPE